MVNIQVQVDDELLSDFYKSLGAIPKDKWSEDEKNKWLETMYFQPFITTKLIEATEQYRTNAAYDESMAIARQKTLADQEKAKQIHDELIENLPESVKPEPIENIDRDKTIVSDTLRDLTK